MYDEEEMEEDEEDNDDVASDAMIKASLFCEVRVNHLVLLIGMVLYMV